jgi:hypothetical protein
LEITQTTLANDEWEFERRLWQLVLSILLAPVIRTVFGFLVMVVFPFG